jgi:Tfp pilus assembly protein FimV
MNIRHFITKPLVTFCLISVASFPAYAQHSHQTTTDPETKVEASDQTYVVQQGDVFGKICQKYQPAGVSLKDVMKAFYTINKDAFKNHDQTKLIVGSTLRVPTPQSLGASSAVTQDNPTKNQDTPKTAPSEKAVAPEVAPTPSTVKPAPAVAAPLVTQAAAVTSTSTAKPLQPITAPVATPIAPGADKPAAELTTSENSGAPVADTAANTDQPSDQSASAISTSETQKDSSGLTTWLEFAGIVAAVLLAIGFYFRKRKNLIEAQQKQLESLLK